MITPNKYMTWEEAVKAYPDHYVVFDENAKIGWARQPLEGMVIAVCTNDEIDDFRIKCRHEGKVIYFDRTRFTTKYGGYYTNL